MLFYCSKSEILQLLNALLSLQVGMLMLYALGVSMLMLILLGVVAPVFVWVMVLGMVVLVAGAAAYAWYNYLGYKVGNNPCF